MRSRREHLAHCWSVDEFSRNRRHGPELCGRQRGAIGNRNGRRPGDGWRLLLHNLVHYRLHNLVRYRLHNLVRYLLHYLVHYWLHNRSGGLSDGTGRSLQQVPFAIRALHVGSAFVGARFQFALPGGGADDLRRFPLGRRRGRAVRADCWRGRRRFRLARSFYRRSINRLRRQTRRGGRLRRTWGILTGAQPQLRKARSLRGGRPARYASAETLQAEARFLLRNSGQPARAAGHLANQPGDGRIFERQRNGGGLHAPHGVVIVGNLPLRRPGERLGNLVFGDAHRARLIAVEHDFELGNPGGEVLRDQAIGVAQPSDAGLNDQVDRGALFEKAGPHQIKPRPHINDDVIEVLARDGQQPVDGVVGSGKLGKLARSRKH